MLHRRRGRVAFGRRARVRRLASVGGLQRGVSLGAFPAPPAASSPRRARVSPSAAAAVSSFSGRGLSLLSSSLPAEVLSGPGLRRGAAASSRLGPAVLAAGTLPPAGLGVSPPARFALAPAASYARGGLGPMRSSFWASSVVQCPAASLASNLRGTPRGRGRRREDVTDHCTTMAREVEPTRRQGDSGRRARRERERYRRHRPHVAGAVEQWSSGALFTRFSRKPRRSSRRGSACAGPIDA
jgi:hypothetical protein